MATSPKDPRPPTGPRTTETVTAGGTTPSVSPILPSGAPIADERVGAGRGKGGAKWLWIALAVIVILLLLVWTFGGFGTGETVAATTGELPWP